MRLRWRLRWKATDWHLVKTGSQGQHCEASGETDSVEINYPMQTATDYHWKSHCALPRWFLTWSDISCKHSRTVCDQISSRICDIWDFTLFFYSFFLFPLATTVFANERPIWFWAWEKHKYYVERFSSLSRFFFHFSRTQKLALWLVSVVASKQFWICYSRS